MESYSIIQIPVAENSSPSFRCSDDNINGDDEDDSSQAVEEHLRQMMNRPLMDDFDTVNDDADNDKITVSLDISQIGRNDTTDSQLEWNDISLIIFQDESIESIDISDVVKDTSLLKSSQSNTARDISVHKAHQCSTNKNKNKHIKKKFETTNDDSSSSEGTHDERQNSDHTCPETPPTPLSFESVDQRSTTSILSVHEILQQQDDSHLQHSTPTNSTFSNTSALILPTPSNSDKYDKSIRTSMAYNPITSHSPRRKSRSRRQRATIGMSLFSCLDGGSDDVLSDSDNMRNSSVFRKRNVEEGEVDGDDDGVVSTCDSEEALELAAKVIRSQLLQNEMLDLAAEAEKAADSGMDRFTRHPVAGVIQDDLIGTTTPYNRSYQRNLSIQAMRRSLSEGSYAPPHPTRISERNTSSSNFVVNIFPESIIPLSTSYINSSVTTISPAKNAIELRDVNEVFPTFQSFHAQLRTHFIRGDISPGQLSFQEEKKSDEKNDSAMTMRAFDVNIFSVNKNTPPRQVYPFCKSEDSPLGSVFSLPLCSNEMTATPLTTNRKLVGDPNQKHLPFSIDPALPVNNFLQNFSFVDQWSNAISSHCRSNANHLLIEATQSTCNEDDPPNDDLSLVNLLSVQVITKNNAPRFPRKIEMLPDLEHDFISHLLRQATLSSTIRLQPKIGHRCYSQDTANDIVSFAASSASSLNLAHSIHDPRALFDETEYDSDEDGCNTMVMAVVDPDVSRMHSAVEQYSSLNSLLNDPALVWTPTIGNTRMHYNDDVTDDAGRGVDTTVLPPPPSIPDFVTPARLRKIRGSGRRTMSYGSADTVEKAIAAHLILPIATTTSSQDVLPLQNLKLSDVDKIENISRQHNKNETQMEIEYMVPKHCDKMHAMKQIPENDVSKMQNESQCSDCVTENDILDSSLSVLDLSQLSNPFHEEVIVRQKICLDNVVASEDEKADSKADPVNAAWLNETPNPKSFRTPKCCRSLDGYIAKVPSHHDCGCLSLSPASSTCSDDDIRRNDATINGSDMLNASTASLRKVLSSGAINDHQSWDAFLEHFHAASPTNSMGKSPSSTPKQKNSIRDAMNILSSTLSPNRKNNCASQETAQSEQTLQVLHDQMKENDEFMNNFLYCSKPLEDFRDDITTTTLNAEDVAVSKADRTISSFLCMDDNIMNCGETDNTYCCNYFFDGALTMGNIILPTSFATRHRPASHANGTVHSHQRVRSFINLGGGTQPASRRESYHTESTNPHNSSSWLDLASELDGAFDTWVLGEKSQAHISNLDESETCLSHVSFQPPTLKLRNILEDNSRDESDEETDREDGELEENDIWIVDETLKQNHHE